MAEKVKHASRAWEQPQQETRPILNSISVLGSRQTADFVLVANKRWKKLLPWN